MTDTATGSEANDPIHREPLRSFIEHLSAMATGLMRSTGHPLRRITLPVDTALLLGLPPGSSMLIATAAGTVLVSSDTPMLHHATFPVG